MLPTGSLALPEYSLRRMVAASPTFQAAGGTLENIHFRDVDFSLPRPVAVINTTQHGAELSAGGSRNLLDANGELSLYLALDHAGEGIDAEITAKNFFGGVIDDIRHLAAADQTDDPSVPQSHLALRSIRFEGLARIPDEHRPDFGDFWFAVYLFAWSDQ